MAGKEDTAEMLALKFPHSHHLLDWFEKACAEVEIKGGGWGRLLIDSQGLSPCGRLLVRFFDVQHRMFLRNDDETNNKRIK